MTMLTDIQKLARQAKRRDVTNNSTRYWESTRGAFTHAWVQTAFDAEYKRFNPRRAF